MFITLSCYLPSVLGLILIGMAILLKNTQGRINRAFFCVALSIALWLLGLCLSYIHINYNLSLWELRIAVAIGTFIAPALIYFSIYFPVQIRKTSIWLHIILGLCTSGFFILSLTPLMIPAITFREYSVAIKGITDVYTLQSIYEILGAITCFGILLGKLKRVGHREQSQIIFVVIGLVVAAVVSIISNLLLVLAHAATYLSDMTTGLAFVVFVGTTAYAIVRHKLFDLRIAIARAVGFVVTVGVVSIIYAVLVIMIMAPIIYGQSFNAAQLLLFLPPTIIIALTAASLQRTIARLTNRLFLQDSYDSREVLDRFADTLISDNDLSIIMTRGMHVLQNALRPTQVLLVVLQDDGQVFRQFSIGRVKSEQASVLVDEVQHFRQRLVVKDDAQNSNWSPVLDAHDVALVLRLDGNVKAAGVLFLGPKQNGRTYTHQDIGLLDVSAKNFGVAIENAKKYTQIAAFADTLRAEVLHATTKLRKANRALKTLDSLKDDFISMASHQLRSPATSVHDAVKMLEQDYLKPAERRRIIELAAASSERLVNVITDMLSVARIQAGHFDLEKTEVDLGELTDRAILQASALAHEKNITVSIDKPAESLVILVDRAKVNEIMANYIENAIKYSNQGTTIHVSLVRSDSRIDFRVRDQGMGVPEAERGHLFGKFYRATNARHEHPNGNGIGLFVVKTVVQAHGGDVYYEAQQSGSLFGFWLPLGTE